jgi:hypothetical protein
MQGTTRAGTERHAGRRILADTMRQAFTGRTRVSSPRQLPTNHDYAGELNGSIREYQSDQPSSTAGSALARVVSSRRRQREKIERAGSLS